MYTCHCVILSGLMDYLVEIAAQLSHYAPALLHSSLDIKRRLVKMEHPSIGPRRHSILQKSACDFSQAEHLEKLCCNRSSGMPSSKLLSSNTLDPATGQVREGSYLHIAPLPPPQRAAQFICPYTACSSNFSTGGPAAAETIVVGCRRSCKCKALQSLAVFFG